MYISYPGWSTDYVPSTYALVRGSAEGSAAWPAPIDRIPSSSMLISKLDPSRNRLCSWFMLTTFVRGSGQWISYSANDHCLHSIRIRSTEYVYVGIRRTPDSEEFIRVLRTTKYYVRTYLSKAIVGNPCVGVLYVLCPSNSIRTCMYP
jgi:hypothetical protein